MKKEVLKYLAGRLIPALVSLALIVLVIRYLGPVEYGRYSLLLYTALLVITLDFHWVQVSIRRFLGGMPRETNVVMSRFFDLTTLNALFSTLLIVLIGLFYFHLGLVELALVALFTFLTHFYLFHQAILEAYHCSVRTAILEGTDQILVLIALLAGLFFFELRNFSVIFGSLVFGLAGVLLLRVVIRVRGLLTIDLKHLYWDSRFSGKVIGFGYGIALWLFFSHLLMAADRFIIMEYFGYHDAGMYSGLKDLLFKLVTFASFPIYISYQSKISDQWNAHHQPEAWKTIKEAISFEILIFIIVFIIFMVFKPMLFDNLLKIPELNFWLIYLPVLMASFLWQVALLFQRFLELVFKSSRILIAMGVCVALNIVLNLIFVPRNGMVASSIILLLTSLLYAGFMVLVALISSKKLQAG